MEQVALFNYLIWGSKFISAGSTPGQYNNLKLTSDENVYKAGIEVTLASAGNEITFTYNGNFSVPAHNVNVFGNWTIQSQTTTSSVNVGDGQMLTHAHYANVAQLHFGSTPSMWISVEVSTLLAWRMEMVESLCM